MSVWKEILQRDMDDIKTMNFTKLNVIQQAIADMFMKEKLTIREVDVVLSGMENKEMVNRENAICRYKTKNRVLLDAEGIE